MKKFLIILAILIPFTMQAQKKGYKLVETSNPKGKPSWVTNYRNGYINVQAIEAASLSEAESTVYTDLLGNIAMAVSSNIEVVIDRKTEEIIKEKGITVTEYIDVVKTEAKIRVAKMPDFQGITLNKGEIYYERYYCKKTGEDYYNYYVLYPFSQFDLYEMIEKYNAQERLISERIAKNESVAYDFYRTDDIEKAIRDLANLATELGKDDIRIKLIDNAKSLLRSKYKEISVDVIDNRREKIIFRLVYDGKPIVSSSMPKLSSNCAQEFDCRKNDGEYVVTFDDAFCYDESNSIKIYFNFGSGNVCKNVYLK